VKPGDILVGKVTPKGETEPTAEQKLLRAIFGQKAEEVRDASLKVPPGAEGVVVDVKVFSRKERGAKTDKEDKNAIAEIERERDRRQDEENAQFRNELREALRHIEKSIVHYETGEVILKPGAKNVPDSVIDYVLSNMNSGMLPVEGAAGADIKRRYQAHTERSNDIRDDAANREERIRNGDDLQQGVIKVCKVYVATKRKLQVGDKMAGRHGNKGVVARIMPQEDMPYLADGTPVDIVLNPLGVPSRMNIGQILETHLGWAARALGFNFATPVFDGASEDAIREQLKLGREAILRRNEDNRRYDEMPVEEQMLDVNHTGQVTLFDGATGERFDRPVTVGVMYMLKLAHMVDDKMHARATGPYSLVTQQPLGGKAQFGGQRFGEMEVWALEAYGAAYTLQELLTVKSDDVQGRTRIYDSIISGENALKPGIPESFNVLVKELQGLGLNLELLTPDTGDGEPDDDGTSFDAATLSAVRDTTLADAFSAPDND
jgi:DNA-directed RNA polymerase subunit beta